MGHLDLFRISSLVFRVYTISRVYRIDGKKICINKINRIGGGRRYKDGNRKKDNKDDMGV